MERDQVAEPPSRRTLFMVFFGGLVVAGVLLVCIVMPAEYGIDPIGTGKALGLTGLAQVSERVAAKPASGSPEATGAPATSGAPGATAAQETAVAPPTVADAKILPVLQPEPVASRWGEAASVTGAFIPQAGQFRLDSRKITLGPREGLEIKYHMNKAAGIVYSWTASAPVLYDFHGQPDVAPPDAPKTEDDYFESYDHDDASGKTQFHGTLVAPSTGIQGWFWENPSADTVTIELAAAGFFDWIYQNRDDETTKLKPLGVDALPSHPQLSDELL